MKLPIYLDNHATTRVHPRVVDAMLPYFADVYGNAASKHHEYGWNAEAAVERARRRVSALIGARDEEIVFTSGATESINLAMKGVAEAHASKGKHIITAAIEHRAVLDVCRRLEQYGFDVTYLRVDGVGSVSPDDVARAIIPNTILVSIMMANNEIGTIAPIKEIGQICRSRGVVFHTDATQAVGKLPVSVEQLNVDLLSFSAHKIHGPKGVGALYVRSAQPRIQLMPQLDGGGHERGLRSGTLNVPAIVGFGEAAVLANSGLQEHAERMQRLRDMLEAGLVSRLPDVRVNAAEARLPNNLSITFRGVKADRLMMSMKDIAVSSGSACSSAAPTPSHVLKAIGLNDDEVQSTIRFGLSRFTTEEEIRYAIARVVETVEALRSIHHQPIHA